METLQRKRIAVVNARLIVITVLSATPVLLYVAAGTYALWKTNLLVWLWWILPVCWAATYLVARLWMPAKTVHDSAPQAGHFTQRDTNAAQIVLRYQETVDALTPKDLTNLHFYLSQFEALSEELAGHYHPDSEDPYSALTVPELAAAARLVADDLEQLVLHSVPGSRLLTVRQWRSFGDTPKWVSRIRNSVWAGSFLLNPLNIVRYGVSRVTVDKVGSGLQSEIMAGIYVRFIRQVGFYLIEMNSGRLRGGADVYRKTFESTELRTQPSEHDAAAKEFTARSVTIGLIGQIGAGKSSLINYLTDSDQATVGVPQKSTATARYELKVSTATEETAADEAISVELLDSPGYDVDGSSRKQMRALEACIADSDILLLVTDVRNPTKSADLKTLSQVVAHYGGHPNLRQPPIIVVLTHIDQIMPETVWSPPTNWANPETAQERSIVQAIESAGQAFSEFEGLVVDVTAVCADVEAHNRWGLNESLLPAIVQQLDGAQSAALLQAFEKSLDQGWASTLAGQLKTGGVQLVKLWLAKKRNK